MQLKGDLEVPVTFFPIENPHTESRRDIKTSVTYQEGDPALSKPEAHMFECSF